MSTTVVDIVQDGQYRLAQPPQVIVIAGNEVQFLNSGAAETLLVLTAETENILSPKPSSPVKLIGGESVIFRFLDPPESGEYLAQVLPEGETSGALEGDGMDGVSGAVLTIRPSGNRGDIHVGH